MNRTHADYTSMAHVLLALGLVLAAWESASAQPTITAQPRSRHKAAGTSASFSVTASGASPLTYQWRQNEVDRPGATDSTLTITNLQLTDAGAYTVVVADSASAATSQVAQLSVALGRVYTNAAGLKLPYRLFLPPRDDPQARYPLVLYWHGLSDVGIDNVAQLGDSGQFVFLSASNQVRYPCFYLAPQLPRAPASCEEAAVWADQSIELLTLLQAEFSIDPDRLHVTGGSLGGQATWMHVVRHPEVFAAAVPICGGLGGCTNANTWNVGMRTAVWNFHAADDSTVDVLYSDVLVAPFRSGGGRLVYTRYPQGGHGIFDTVYQTPGLVDWVMSQQRGKPSTEEPLLVITHPTSEPMHRTAAARLDLAGSAGARGQHVTQIAWENTANGSQGMAAGTNLWNVTAIPLAADRTNVVVVTATAVWPSGAGGPTTFNSTLSVVCAPIHATLAVQGSTVTLSWTGGVGPFSVQWATDLGLADWTDYRTHAEAPVALPLEGAARFYRVRQ